MTLALPGFQRQAGARRRGLDLWTVGTAVIAGLVALPILAVVVMAVTPDSDAWRHMVATVLPRYTLNTLALMALVGIGVSIIGVGTAWLVAMCRFPGRDLFEWALLLPLAIPAYVIAIVYVEHLEYAGPVQGALRALFGWTSARDYWFPEIRSLGGAAAMLTLVLFPYVYLLARTAFVEQCVCLLEASRTLGRSPWRTFWGVALPMARPAIAVGVALALMETISDFGTVNIFAVHTFTTGIYDVWLGMYDAPGAAQLAAALLMFVLLLVGLERYSRRHMSYGHATRRHRPLPKQALAGWRAAAASLACALPVLLGFAVPAATLAVWAWQTAPHMRLDDYAKDIATTLTMAGLAALLISVIAIFLGYAMRLSGAPALRGLVRFASLGYALPGSVIAVGTLIPFAVFDNAVDGFMRQHFGLSTGLLLSGTAVAVLFAYLVRFLALSYGSVESSLGRVTANIDGAARTLGLGPAATLMRVHMPMIRGGVLAAALLVFVDVMKELPATLILRPFNFSTLATRIYEYAKDERFEETGLWSVSIVLFGVIPLILMSRAIARSRPGARPTRAD
jgi:iron(III) transport system permease protein